MSTEALTSDQAWELLGLDLNEVISFSVRLRANETVKVFVEMHGTRNLVKGLASIFEIYELRKIKQIPKLKGYNKFKRPKKNYHPQPLTLRSGDA